MSKTIATLAASSAMALALATGGAAQAQTQTTAQKIGDANIIALERWSAQDHYAGMWSADRLIDADVYGPTGEEIGEVENLLVDDQGRIVAVIAEVGGFWDIGDTHVAVPWQDVTVTSYDRVSIPVTEETVEDYDLFEREYFTRREAGKLQAASDDITTGPRIWKASELLGDYVTLQNDVRYGYVSDLLFDKQGELKSVVVNPSSGYGAYGPYAYPYYGYGYGWDPGLDYYGLPYGRDEVAGLDRYDYGRLDEGVFE